MEIHNTAIRQVDILNLLRLIAPVAISSDFIRIGSEYDGGYIVPNMLSDISSVISIGVADDDSFDRFFSERNIKIFQFDPTIDSPPSALPNTSFFKVPFGAFNGQMHSHVDRILQICHIEDESDVLVKTDSEGGEWYGLLMSSDAALGKIKILTGEFHQFEQLSDPLIFEFMYKTLLSLSRHFFPVSVTPNSTCAMSVIAGIPIPNLLEITYVRRTAFPTDFVVRQNLAARHELARPNRKGQDQMLWNPSWFSLA